MKRSDQLRDFGNSYKAACQAMAHKGDYQTFLNSKRPAAKASGIEISADDLSPYLFDFQRDVTAFCLRQGRAGLFLDTGLGKTLCQLEFAERARHDANGRALILTPLAVARQIEREGQKFGYDARVIRDQSEARDGINICNYDRLDKLDPDEFGVVCLDESSIIKNFTGKTTRALIDAFSTHRFKLAATATPAPNDHMELGTHSEFLNIMASNEMLSRFFINDTSQASQQWRLKGHAEEAFWDWMASWCRMAQSPDDLGYDGSRFVLPELKVIRHKTHGDARAAAGTLFVEEVSATRLHDLKRQTIAARSEFAASIAVAESDLCVIWCDTDYEADALAERLPEAVEVRGSMSIEAKEESLAAFAAGEARIIITKPSIAGFGVNWQHCNRMIFVGRSFSYEAWYQAVRRCWRFGQTRPVEVHIIVAEGEDQIGRVIERKSTDHDRMKTAMSAAMRRAMGRSSMVKVAYEPHHLARLPVWIRSYAA